MPALTERRKADRAKMAEAIVAIANEFGCQVGIEKEGENSIAPCRIQVSVVTARGLSCSFDFDGESCQPDVYVNAWNLGLQTDACLSDRFPGSVNPHHFRKCTTVRYGFDALCGHVRQVLAMAADGSVFDPEREAARVAKHGTWQEQEAQWEEYREEWRAQKAAEAAAAR